MTRDRNGGELPGDRSERTRSQDAPGSESLVRELQLRQRELRTRIGELREAGRRLEQSRAALVHSEKRYRDLFDRSPIGYARLDTSGMVHEANQTLGRLLEAEPLGLVGQRLADLVAPASRRVWEALFSAASRGEWPDATHVVLHGRGGAVRRVEVGARRIDGVAGELRVTVVDVTAVERAEAERAESERQRRLLVDALPVAVVYVDPDGRVAFCNRSFERLAGVPVGAAAGRLLSELLGSESHGALCDPLTKVASGSSARFEGPLWFSGPARRFVSALFAPDLDVEGRVRGFYLLIDDRTDLAEARRGLREAASQAALAEERERRALAADLHDDVGQLLSLASIKLRGLQDELSAAERAKQAAELNELIRDTRERITTLTFQLSPPLLYDVGLVAAVEWLAENLQQRYGLETTVEAPREVPGLDDASRATIFRAVRELLINVARHAGTQRARVVVEAAPEGVQVAVEDDGVGFELASDHAGFGLGKVFDRVESLGGRIVVDTAPGKGMRTSMTVPLAGDRS